MSKAMSKAMNKAKPCNLCQHRKAMQDIVEMVAVLPDTGDARIDADLADVSHKARSVDQMLSAKCDVWKCPHDEILWECPHDEIL